MEATRAESDGDRDAQPPRDVVARFDWDDCLEGMASIDPGSVHLILTDPPYGNITEKPRGGYASQRQFGGVLQGDREYEKLMADALPLLKRVAAKDAWAAVFCEPRSLRAVWGPLESSGWQFRSLLIWEKDGSSFNLGIRRAYEMILLMRRGRPPLEYQGRDVLKYKRATDRIHPTQKPIALLRDLVRWLTPEDGTVFDPFAGSGSSLEAAILEGRNAVGFEIDERYHATGWERLDGILRQEGGRWG